MLTILAFIAVVIFLFSGVTANPTPHLEWVSGIQALISFATLAIWSSWLQARAKRREKIIHFASPLIAKIDLPCRPFFYYILPLISLASLVPPLLFDSGYWNDTRGVLFLHFLLIAFFLDLFLFASRGSKEKIIIGEESDLGKYRDHIDGAVEASLKGISSDSLTLAERGLTLLPTSFPFHTKDIEFRSLYLLDNLEVLAHRAIDKTLYPFIQKILGRTLRLSGNLLNDSPPLATAGVESAGRIVQTLIQKGHLEAADKALFTFAQGIRGLKYLPTGLGDFLIRTVIELEKSLESLYKANKNRPVKTLLVPLAEMKRILSEERFTSHTETLLGQRELDRVIELFRTLETVLLTTPKPPSS
jgi:hypothetical protein